MQVPQVMITSEHSVFPFPKGLPLSGWESAASPLLASHKQCKWLCTTASLLCWDVRARSQRPSLPDLLALLTSSGHDWILNLCTVSPSASTCGRAAAPISALASRLCSVLHLHASILVALFTQSVKGSVAGRHSAAFNQDAESKCAGKSHLRVPDQEVCAGA